MIAISMRIDQIGATGEKRVGLDLNWREVIPVPLLPISPLSNPNILVSELNLVSGVILSGGNDVYPREQDIASKIRSIKNHGMGNHKYEHINVGVNSRLDTIQASILIEKLKIFPTELEKRNRIAQFYNNNIKPLDPLDLIVPDIDDNICYSWAQYTLISNNRNLIMEKLKYTGLLFLILTVYFYTVGLSIGIINWLPFAGLTTILLSIYCIRKILNK